MALTLLPLTLAGTGLGRAQGDQHFVRLGWLYAVLAATRFGLGITVLVVTRSVTATVVAALVGAVLGWLLVRWRESLPWTSGGRLDLDVRREALHTTHALLAMFVLTSCDLLLARYVLPADEAGEYAAGSVVLNQRSGCLRWSRSSCSPVSRRASAARSCAAPSRWSRSACS